MRRSKSLRVSVAIGLLLTLVLVNRHVASIKPAQAGDFNFKSELVIEDGESHIELVSIDRYPRVVVDSARAASSHAPIPPPASISQTIAKPAPSPAVQAWLEPTRPAPSTRFVPKQIPVNVPGEFSWDDDDDSDLDDNREDEAQLGQRHKNSKPTSSSPPKPKSTPNSDRIVMLGRMSYEDATWLEDELPE
ncbi:hypothetical protein N7481_008316 [Penicillium waksmanii]|uniref:uncharacterized protein n=1 Tax=Penicillium waksmanii TaxID=69791 RepID=UPI002547705A|nr:uncharacterized protein N7481_008316 [Penicillium waksmanii]KAJ5981018.1 hypothetical protein N7481_008316 [Penicillium waksmanii]